MANKSIAKILKDLQQFEADVAKALSKIETKLFSKSNVVGYGVGYKVTGRKTTNKIAAVIFVSKKVTPSSLKPKDKIPKFILVKNKRVPTDVQRIPKYSLQANPGALNQKEYRPIEMGTSIESAQHDTLTYGGTGTSAAVVTDPKIPTSKFMLSAGHVFLAVGNDVIQQGSIDGGQNYIPPPPPFVGPIDVKQRCGNVTKMAVGVDAGIAECKNMVTNIISLGSPNGTEMPIIGMPVQKSGRTTGVTQGEISGTHFKIKGKALSDYYKQCPQIVTGSATTPILANAVMGNLFIVKGKSGPFTQPGDSGSLVMAGDLQSLKDWYDRFNSKENLGLKQKDINKIASLTLNNAIGLHIIGDPKGSVSVQINTVETALGVKLL